MSFVFVPTSSDFPQDNTNRPCSKIVTDLLQFTGGLEDSDAQDKAKLALQMSVREYNGFLWRFNILTDPITLTAGKEFTLNADFRAPLAATLLDASGDQVWRVRYEPYELFLEKAWDRRGTGGQPLVYTARNTHQNGIIEVWPKLVTPLTWPTLQVEYFRRIILPSGPDDVLNVPQEVEAGIAQRALSILIAMSRTFKEARDQTIIAERSMTQLKVDYQGFTDY